MYICSNHSIRKYYLRLICLTIALFLSLSRTTEDNSGFLDLIVNADDRAADMEARAWMNYLPQENNLHKDDNEIRGGELKAVDADINPFGCGKKPIRTRQCLNQQQIIPNTSGQSGAGGVNNGLLFDASASSASGIENKDHLNAQRYAGPPHADDRLGNRNLIRPGIVKPAENLPGRPLDGAVNGYSRAGQHNQQPPKPSFANAPGDMFSLRPTLSIPANDFANQWFGPPRQTAAPSDRFNELPPGAVVRTQNAYPNILVRPKETFCGVCVDEEVKDRGRPRPRRHGDSSLWSSFDSDSELSSSACPCHHQHSSTYCPWISTTSTTTTTSTSSTSTTTTTSSSTTTTSTSTSTSSTTTTSTSSTSTSTTSTSSTSTTTTSSSSTTTTSMSTTTTNRRTTTKRHKHSSSGSWVDSLASSFEIPSSLIESDDEYYSSSGKSRHHRRTRTSRHSRSRRTDAPCNRTRYYQHPNRPTNRPHYLQDHVVDDQLAIRFVRETTTTTSCYNWRYNNCHNCQQGSGCCARHRGGCGGGCRNHCGGGGCHHNRFTTITSTCWTMEAEIVEQWMDGCIRTRTTWIPTCTTTTLHPTVPPHHQQFERCFYGCPCVPVNRDTTIFVLPTCSGIPVNNITVPVIPAVLPACGVPAVLTSPIYYASSASHATVMPPVVTVTVTAQTFCSEMIICNPVGSSGGGSSGGSGGGTTNPTSGSNTGGGSSGSASSGSGSSTRTTSTASGSTTTKVTVTVTPSSINTSTVKSNEARIVESQAPFWITMLVAALAILVVG